jgi:hypothetical protein
VNLRSNDRTLLSTRLPHTPAACVPWGTANCGAANAVVELQDRPEESGCRLRGGGEGALPGVPHSAEDDEETLSGHVGRAQMCLVRHGHP